MGREKKKTIEEEMAALIKENDAADAEYERRLKALRDNRAKAKGNFDKKRTHLLIYLGGVVMSKATKDPVYLKQTLAIAKEELPDNPSDRAKDDLTALTILMTKTAEKANPEKKLVDEAIASGTSPWTDEDAKEMQAIREVAAAHPDRRYLTLPEYGEPDFDAEKDAVKALGAKYDSENKAWYIPAADLPAREKEFAQWL